MNSKYINLEPGIMNEIGVQPLSFDANQDISTYATFNFLYVSSITLIIAAAAVMYIIAGGWRIEASERGIRKSNETFKRVTLGLLGVLSLFVILYTINKDLLRGDVGLSALKASVQGGTGAVVPITRVLLSGTPATCQTKETVISRLNSGNLCGQSNCSVLSGCNYQRYMNEINAASAKYGVDKNLIITIMCKENRSLNPTSQNTNTDSNGRVSYDCGLMQVNQNTPCTPASYDPGANIDAGVLELNKIKNAQIYPGIPQAASIAASYNAGPGYNQASVDCTQATGFPNSIPKWACPINPGETRFNMCAVNSYACDVSACVTQLSGVNL